MSQADFWYIRFPDGRILRAANTALLRQELSAGHIPLGSTVRRAPDDEWVLLQWTQEFADLVDELSSRPAPEPRPRRPAERHETTKAAGEHAATAGSRLGASRLHFIGVRGYLDELLAALDSTLVAKKLMLGAAAGLLLGIFLALQQAAWFERDSPWWLPAWCLAGAAAIALGFLTALLSKLTYLELARLRPPLWREGLDGLAGLALRVIVAQLIVRGLAWGPIVLLRWLPYWLGPSGEEAWTWGQEILAGNALALGMMLEALLWPVFFLSWLLPPILVVEGSSIGGGLRQWLALLRRHLGRVFLYQMLAVGLGLLLTMPFLLLVAPMFLPTFFPPEALREVAARTRFVLLGLAFAPLLTYWIVANVFVYLNLRYGASSSR